jgi:hypothetical protein
MSISMSASPEDQDAWPFTDLALRDVIGEGDAVFLAARDDDVRCAMVRGFLGDEEPAIVLHAGNTWAKRAIAAATDTSQIHCLSMSEADAAVARARAAGTAPRVVVVLEKDPFNAGLFADLAVYRKALPQATVFYHTTFPSIVPRGAMDWVLWPREPRDCHGTPAATMTLVSKLMADPGASVSFSRTATDAFSVFALLWNLRTGSCLGIRSFESTGQRAVPAQPGAEEPAKPDAEEPAPAESPASWGLWATMKRWWQGNSHGTRE